jgi:hypothetical protein
MDESKIEISDYFYKPNPLQDEYHFLYVSH